MKFLRFLKKLLLHQFSPRTMRYFISISAFLLFWMVVYLLLVRPEMTTNEVVMAFVGISTYLRLVLGLADLSMKEKQLESSKND